MHSNSRVPDGTKTGLPCMLTAAWERTRFNIRAAALTIRLPVPFQIQLAACQCLQDALGRGALSAELLRRWLRLMKVPSLGALASAVPGLRDRILGNPRFLLVLGIELAMGVSAKTSAEYRARGDRFYKVGVLTSSSYVP